MSPDQFQQALQHIQLGEKSKAKKILANLVREQPGNESLWLWLHVCVESKEKKIYCLQRALEINPKRAHARKELNSLLASIAQEKSATISLPSENNREKEISTPISETPEKMSNAGLSEETKPEINPKPPKRKRKKRKFQDNESRIQIPFKPPQIILVHPGENSFTNQISNKVLYSDQNGLYGKSLLIGGLRITPIDMPSCIEIDILRCSTCTFFAPSDCLLRNDPYLLDEVKRYFKPKHTWLTREINRRKRLLKIIHSELEEHGRPLHYSIVAKIIADRFPKHNPTEKTVLRLMSSHSELFEKVSVGVYMSRKINSDKKKWSN